MAQWRIESRTVQNSTPGKRSTRWTDKRSPGRSVSTSKDRIPTIVTRNSALELAEQAKQLILSRIRLRAARRRVSGRKHRASSFQGEILLVAPMAPRAKRAEPVYRAVVMTRIALIYAHPY